LLTGEDGFSKLILIFIDEVLLIQTNDGSQRQLPLRAQTVAAFHSAVFTALDELDIRVIIHGSPNEVPDPIPFQQDTIHATYDPDYAQRFWQVLLQTEMKCSTRGSARLPMRATF
jgi:hypothetical protein